MLVYTYSCYQISNLFFFLREKNSKRAKDINLEKLPIATTTYGKNKQNFLFNKALKHFRKGAL